MSNPAQIHETAIVEADVRIGDSTCVWDGVHIRRGANIGKNCIIGEKSYIAYDVSVGDLCKINANVYICAGVTVQDGVMIAAHTVFTNDLLPRATDPEVLELRSSDPDDTTLQTKVMRGTTIGANCTIGPGVVLGEFCMIGMGSVVTRNVPKHTLVAGNPATIRGLVCSCGKLVARIDSDDRLPAGPHKCECGRVIPSEHR
jgi:acetyltransferase-like isoleucine patch superfamily enzyme